MNAFDWITTTLALVLGLGTTRLLLSALAVFRSRGRARMDWVPMVWAGCIFLAQLQFWWAVHELPLLVAHWTFLHFLSLVGLVLTLFVASALVLPDVELKEGDSLTAAFRRDGRWALVFLSLYFALAALADWSFWGVSPWKGVGLVNPALVAFPPVYLSLRQRKAQCVTTVLYAAFYIWAAWLLSPKEY